MRNGLALKLIAIVFAIAGLVLYVRGGLKNNAPLALTIFCLLVASADQLAAFVKDINIAQIFNVRFWNRADRPPSDIIPTAPRKLSEEEVSDKRKVADKFTDLPGRDSSSFDIIDGVESLRNLPGLEPMIPAYLLDSEFRILDWNEAFSLVFDNTMEGRRGVNVLEWTFFLDNYEEILKTGERDFSNTEKLPYIHREEVHYTSRRYGSFVAEKLALRINGEEGELEGWYVRLQPRFSEPSSNRRLLQDLIIRLRWENIWRDYSLCYDRILTSSHTYRQLLNSIMGESDLIEMKPLLGPRLQILDLGAGTGNLTIKLAQIEAPGITIFAIDKSDMMLDILRRKCSKYIEPSPQRARIIPIKQDITSLNGISSDSVDRVFMNNVLYTLDYPQEAMREAYRVLKPGGLLVLSGPKRDTKLKVLFNQLKRDLKNSGYYESHRKDFEKVEFINTHYLSSRLFRWLVSDVISMGKQAGFMKVASTEKAYAGQAMILAFEKPGSEFDSGSTEEDWV